MNLAQTPPPGVDFTESPVDPPGALRRQILELTGDQEWRRYPNPRPWAALAKLSDLWSVDPERIVFTRGADEAIDLLILNAVRNGRTIVYPRPAYPGYLRASRRHRACVRTYCAENMPPRATPGELVIVCHPGNPFGPFELAFPQPSQVWDCTYLNPFGPAFGDVLSRTTEQADALVFSLSKVGALAGLRLGGLIAGSNAEARHLRDIQPAFALDYMQVAAWTVATSKEGLGALEMLTRAQLARAEALRNALTAKGTKFWTSSASAFVTARFESTSELDGWLHRYADLPIKSYAAWSSVRITASDIATLRLVE